MKKDIMILKRNGNLEKLDLEKVREDVKTCAERVMIDLTDEAMEEIINKLVELLSTQTSNPTVEQLHSLLEVALEDVNPLVAKSYREYRDYKKDLDQILS